MFDTTRTTTALLEGLHDPHNERVWTEFDQRYRPIIFAFARKLGLDDADAADVAQETITRFITEYSKGKYDRERGRLRSWLISIARFRIADIYRSKYRRREHHGESAIATLDDDHQLTDIWEQQRRTAMLREALSQLREKTRTADRTIDTFELLVLQQMPPEAVAEQMQVNVQEVYLAKSRVAKRLREILERLEHAYDEGR